MSGMVFKRGAEGEIKKAKNARIAVYTCPFDLTQTETKVSILISYFNIYCDDRKSLLSLVFLFE